MILFGKFCKTSLLEKKLLSFFLDNFRKQLGYFLFNHLVTLYLDFERLSTCKQFYGFIKSKGQTTTKHCLLAGSNVIEIEGLLFLGFCPMRALLGKLVFPVFPIK